MYKQRSIILCAVMIIMTWSAGLAYGLDDIWNLEAVDAEGLGSHPKVGADPIAENQVVIEGVSLASTGELDNIDGGGFEWFSIWVQSEEDRGGIQCWAGPWNKDTWNTWIVEAGDTVRVTGWVADYNSKVFVNDRHSIAIMWDFQVNTRENTDSRACAEPDRCFAVAQ